MRQTWIFVLLLISFLSNGQSRTITGKVLLNNLIPASEALILIGDTLRLGTADNNGDFEVSIPLDTDELQLIALDTEPAFIRIPLNCDNVEIILLAAGIYDYKSHRKVDRARKEMHNKLPELHSMAVAKGVFKGKSVCYERQFLPSKPQREETRKKPQEGKTDIDQ